MELEEQTPAYRGFLRSGAYPSLSLGLRKSSELAGRAASLVALAALAAGAGYKLTQRVVTSDVSISPAHAAPAEPLPAARRGIGALSVAHAPQLAAPIASPVQSAATNLPLTAASSNKRVSLKSEAPRPLAQPADVRPPRRTLAEPAAAPEASAQPEAAVAAAEQARAEIIAKRVRALDEAAHAEPGVGASAAMSVVTPAPPKPALADLPVAPAPALAPKAPAAPALPLKAAASIVDLDVRGSLSASNVRHGVERVRPAFASCYAQAAKEAKRNEFGIVQMRFTIDETGRTRGPKVAHAALPGLEECLRSAIGKLVCKAPDTGTVQASLSVSFAP